MIRDPRVDEKNNDEYLDMMEKYFEQAGKKHYAGQKVDDIKPENMYLVGATPEDIEIARDHSELRKLQNLSEENLPVSLLKPIPDAKWRFFWKIGEREDDPICDFPQVIPQGFPDWQTKMDKWGNKLGDATKVIAQMAAIGMGLPQNTFYDRM